MQSFKRALPDIIKRSKRARNILLLFDFDGTLAPIVDHPADARMPEAWRDRLGTLNRHRHIVVGIVTGRALDDIRNLVRVPGLIYAASHGFDIAKGSRMLLAKGRAYKRHFTQLARALGATLQEYDGVVIENKGTSISVHYRMVQPSQQKSVIRRAEELAQPWIEQHGWSITGGKKILEVRPATQWNKGSAVDWICHNFASNHLPCYIGDDITDEDAFRTLGDRGISIRIGRSSSSQARYYVQRADDLIPWFDELMALRV